MKTGLICGVSGQDGSYLAKLLLEKGYRVVGTSRDAHVASLSNLRRLAIFDQIELVSMVLTDFGSTLQTIAKIKPEEIYNLAGQSSVGLSFKLPVETMESIAIGSINLMEAIRFIGGGIRLYNASSSECFGDTGIEGASEKTPFRPQSPYAVAKSAAHWATANYRSAYGLFASSGILFNHESPLRHERFVTRKIVSSACRIKAKQQDKLRLGNLTICRDWGWAPEYVDAIWRILQHHSPDDFVIATGESHSLQKFVEAVFNELSLNWVDHVEYDELHTRLSDIAFSRGDPYKARTILDWSASFKMRDVVGMMVRAELDANVT